MCVCDVITAHPRGNRAVINNSPLRKTCQDHKGNCLGKRAAIASRLANGACELIGVAIAIGSRTWSLFDGGVRTIYPRRTGRLSSAEGCRREQDPRNMGYLSKLAGCSVEAYSDVSDPT